MAIAFLSAAEDARLDAELAAILAGGEGGECDGLSELRAELREQGDVGELVLDVEEVV